MKIIIVYFSLTGNTKKLAVKIYEILRSKNFEVDLFELENKKRKSFLINCFEAIKGKTFYIEKIPALEKYDFVFIGSPVWAGRITPLIRSFIKEVDFSNKNIFLFTTYGSGLGKSRAMEEFEKLVFEKGGKIIGKLEVKGKKVEENIFQIKEKIEKCLKEL